MVRVWLRPALAALRRQAAPKAAAHFALKAASQQTQQLVAVRAFSSKKEKKSLHDKFVDVEEDLTEVPAEVQFLSKEALNEDDELDPELIEALADADLEMEEGGSDSDSDDELDQLEKLLEGQDIDEDDLLEDDDEDDEESELTDAEWAAKYEKQLSQIELNDARDIDDDRLYIEMPNYDSSLSLASDGDMEEDDDDDASGDVFQQWGQGAAYSPEMLNWMTPSDKRKPFGTGKDKPWKYYVRANHPDPVELAMDVDLLRLFISPTGRIRPRRFTGLTAKQQRQLARGVKISRQLALLPFLSRYPEPSPEQWRAMEEDEIAKLTALAENDDGSNVDDDDDDDEFDDMDEE